MADIEYKRWHEVYQHSTSTKVTSPPPPPPQRCEDEKEESSVGDKSCSLNTSTCAITSCCNNVGSTIGSISMYELMDSAAQARRDAHAPYTGHRVGCAISTDIGTIKGSTVENCAYPNSLCAIKSAIVSAASSGARQFYSVAVAGWRENDVPYICGYCSESLAEFIKDDSTKIGLLQSNSKIVEITFGDLLPSYLKKKEEINKQSDVSVSVSDVSVSTILPEDHLSLSLKWQSEIGALKFDGFSLNSEQATKTSVEDVALMTMAILACKNAYVPISKFPVGAAVLTDKGTFQGANIEHSGTMNATLCAERTALCKAVSNGATDIKKLAVVCYKLPDFGRPCGGCRQSMVEFGDFPILQIRLDLENGTFSYEEGSTSFSILPNCFSPKSLS